MRILFFLLFALSTLGANFYIFYRLVQSIPTHSFIRFAVIAAGILLTAGFVVSLVGRGSIPEAIMAPMYRICTAWFFIFIYFLMFFILMDIIKLTHLLPIERWMVHNWWGFGFSIAVMIVTFSVGYIKYLHKERIELNLQIEKAGLRGSPLKIVAVSDMHLGYTIGRAELESWVELINKEEPDIILIAGDIIDHTVVPLIDQQMDEPLRKLTSKYGTYAIMGNHEYISTAPKSIDFFERANIKLLKDSVALVDDRFYIIGRDDRSNTHRKALHDLTDSLDHSKLMILMDHQPYHLEEAESCGIDFQLSGHTHHGQVWPISLITQAIYEQAHGYLKKSNTHYYVSSGIGIWGGKFRIGTQSEYAVIYVNEAQ